MRSFLAFVSIAGFSSAFTIPHPFTCWNMCCHKEICTSSTSLLMNVYDDWRGDGIVDQLPLDEETVQMCLDELVYSDYGMTMFGVQDTPGKK